MSIERIQITSRDQWLALRRQDITASAIGSLLGVHEYTSAYTTWALKSGKIAEDVETSPAMERGLLLEPVALKLLKRERPKWKLEWNGTPGEMSGIYFRDPEHRIGATPDCFAIDPDRGPGVIQVKTVEKNIFRKKWFQSDGEEDGPPELTPPLWIVVQAIVEAHLTGAKWAAVMPIVVGFGLGSPIIEIPIHAGIIEKLQEKSLDFWRRVAENDPPAPDYAEDGETIARLYSQDNGLEIDLSGDNEIGAALGERKELMEAKKPIEARLEEIKAMLKFKVGPNTYAHFPGWQISNKPTTRKEVLMPEKTFRVLRVKESK